MGAPIWPRPMKPMRSGGESWVGLMECGAVEGLATLPVCGLFDKGFCRVTATGCNCTGALLGWGRRTT
jgi:hypothetical protein